MSARLALSTTLSVLMMAAYALCGPHTGATMPSGQALFTLPGKAEMPAMPAFPSMPGLR